MYEPWIIQAASFNSLRQTDPERSTQCPQRSVLQDLVLYEGCLLGYCPYEDETLATSWLQQLAVGRHMASHSCKRAVGIPVLAENIAGLLTLLFCKSPRLFDLLKSLVSPWINCQVARQLLINHKCDIRIRSLSYCMCFCCIVVVRNTTGSSGNWNL